MSGNADNPAPPGDNPDQRMRDRRAYFLAETHGMLRQPGTNVSASSDAHAWWPLYVSVQREAPYAAQFGPSSDELLIYHRSGPARVTRTIDGERITRLIPAGGFQLIPSGKSVALSFEEHIETVHIYLRRRIIDKVAVELVEGDPSHIGLTPATIDSDPTLAALVEATMGLLDLEEHSTAISAFFLASAIAAHLVRDCYRGRLKGEKDGGGRIVWSRPVSRAVKFMRENLEKPLSIAEISSAANMSQSHMARVLRQETGMSVHQFLVKLRTEKARNLLHRTTLPIAEIAFICGFSHQEHLTNTFKRIYRITPAAYRKAKRAFPYQDTPYVAGQ